MVRALRVMTVEHGVDPRGFALLAFGGAGPLHAAAIADELGMTRSCARARPACSARSASPPPTAVRDPAHRPAGAARRDDARSDAGRAGARDLRSDAADGATTTCATAASPTS